MLKKVLAVDNDRFILEFMKDVLPPDRYELFTANDGLEALDVLDTIVPDIIFVDLVMPHIDGKRLCKIIRGIEKLRDVFVVVLSSAIAEQSIDTEALGIDACIAKGPIEGMAPSILTVLDNPDAAAIKCARGEIIGAEKQFQRRITNELLRLGKHGEAILEVMHEGIIEVVSSGRIVYANPASQSLVGVRESKLLGSDFFQLFSDADQTKVLAEWENTIETQDVSHNCRVRVNDNELILRFLPVKNPDGFSLIVIIDDITERLRMEAELIQAKKREALGTLAGGIAHNFNNLLAAIQGNISVMMFKEGMKQEYLDDLKRLQACVSSGTSITHELLKIAKGTDQKLRMTDLNRIVEKSCELFGTNNKQIRIHKSLQKDIWLVDADSSQLEQVLLNLYINAQQAMPDGGELFIETENVGGCERTIDSPGLIRGQYVRISVRDTGTGIDKKTQEKIFDPFFTTKSKGSGLGLATAQNTIKSHKGSIQVHSSNSKGATFEILLPVSSDQPAWKMKMPEKQVPDGPRIFSWHSKERFLKAAGSY